MVRRLLMDWMIAGAAGHRGPGRTGCSTCCRAVWDDQQVVDIAPTWTVRHLDDGDTVLIVETASAVKQVQVR
jgi:hypothetical protein